MATISASVSSSGVAAPISWTPVTSADTAAEASFFGGRAILEVVGTFNGATVQWEWGSASGTTSAIDTNEHPIGAKFTSAGVCEVELAPGFIKPTFSGGGGSQNLTCKVVYIRT